MRAVIFDMDGVISDTQKVHAKIESEIMADVGVKIAPEEITRRFAGVPTRVNMQIMLDEAGKEGDVDKMLQRKDLMMEEELRNGVDEILGSVNLIKWLEAEGVPIAVATSLDRKKMEIILDDLHLKETMPHAVAGDEVSKGKPDPEIFLKAAQLINAKPEDCIVIEDGSSGIKGANQVGMTTIGFGDHVKGLGDYSADTMDDVRDILEKIL